ncbi:MAG: M23 family metallopeptidase [Hyphomonadaceae bacterium]|nr:M23 family metallopeptidase [Hyphomonadaceae bacterium]
MVRGLIVVAVLAAVACAPPPTTQAAPPAVPEAAAAPPAPLSLPPPPPLTIDCAGAFAQGGVVVCRTQPGAVLVIDGEERGAADADGWVVAGFDRDAQPAATVAVRTPTQSAVLDVSVAARDYSVSRVNGLPPQTVTPSAPEVLARIARESAAKEEARKSRAGAHGFLQNFAWPVQGIMSSPWGSQRILNGEPRAPHYGIDIAAPEGTPIRAPADGVIAMANPDMHFEGGLVMIDHGQGLISYYLHMSRLDVVAGQTVTQGQLIGAVGKKGRATGPHLCWRMRWRDRNLDPALAVQALATARTHFANGALLDAGAAPPNYTPWSPAPTP